MQRLLVIALLVLVANPLSAAGIYRHTDKNGKVVFTDQPPDQADVEEVQLGPINTVPAGRKERRNEGSETAPAAPPAENYQRLDLGGVQNGDELRNPEGPVNLSATPDIPLQPGHTLVFIDNGREITSTTGSAVIESIERGTHTISAEIRDASGTTLVRSAPATIQVLRNHVPRR